MDKLSAERKAELLATPYLDILGAHEKALSRLYHCLSIMLPDAKDFWQGLASEEALHNSIIMTISDKLKNSGWKFKRPVMSYSAINESIAWVEGKRKSFELNGITMKEALELAHYIENAIIERDFFKVADDDVDEVKQAFAEIMDSTTKHRQRIIDEQAKIKWKLLGRKKSAVVEPAEDDGCAETADIIKHAQVDIINGLIRLEEAASILYNVYAECFQEHAAFWSKLGAEEMQHASMLRELLKMHGDGVLFYNLGRFDLDELQKEIEYSLSSAEDAKAGKFQLREAVRRAYCIEKSMSESKFYEIVDSDSEAYKVIARRLSDLTREHVEKMDDFLHNCG